ncbi:FAD/NAD-P-binding domain-containing protein [Russula compacta]|nr:FAD/NAD-P-binding domain-containing protein [Russula compacta]
MEPPFHARDFGGGPNPPTRRQHRSSHSASSFRFTSHSSDAPSHTRDISRQASFHLDFIIIGGGIAGLSVAYALAASGHRVQVLEQARGLKHRPGGIRLPPSATRILSHWEVEKELAEKASITPSSSILDMKTGRSIGQSAWQMGLIEEMGSPFLMVHHADLLEILHRLASSAGARVKFGVTVESVEAAQETPPGNDATSTSIAGSSSRTLRPTVRLKTGEILHADVIIGADGRRSIVRRVVMDEDEEPEAMSPGLSMYTGCVPMAEVRKYAPLRQLVDVGWQIWIGDGRVVLGYPIRQHQEFVVHIWWQDPNGSTAVARSGALDSWDPTTSLNPLRYKDGQMDPRLRFLLDKAGPVSRQSWIVPPPPDTWVDESETIILIGEAAHPQGPGTTYGCTLALENAAILGTLFSHLRSAEQVPTLLYAYQDLCKGRADMVGDLEQQNAEVLFSSPPRVHDGLVRWTALPARVPYPPPGGGLTDAELAEVAEVWGYYAIDAAEEWWVEWGMLRERSQQRK